MYRMLPIFAASAMAICLAEVASAQQACIRAPNGEVFCGPLAHPGQGQRPPQYAPRDDRGPRDAYRDRRPDEGTRGPPPRQYTDRDREPPPRHYDDRYRAPPPNADREPPPRRTSRHYAPPPRYSQRYAPPPPRYRGPPPPRYGDRYGPPPRYRDPPRFDRPPPGYVRARPPQRVYRARPRYDRDA